MNTRYAHLFSTTGLCWHFFIFLMSWWFTDYTFAQSCPVTTVAGGNGYGSNSNQLSFPYSVAIDPAGYIYVSDYYNHRIQKFAPNSTSASSGTTVAGGNGFGSNPDQLYYPAGVTVDKEGYIYVSDYYNHRIQKFAPNSTSASSGTTVAGGNGFGSNSDQLYYPVGVQVGKNGLVYVADSYNHRIQIFPKNSTSASSGTTVAGGNGFGSNPNQLSYPLDITVDGTGYIYIADNYNQRIQKFAPNSTSASSGITVASGNGYGSNANQLAYPYAVTVDEAGYIYVADSYNHRIQLFAPNSTSASSGTTVAGGNGFGSNPDQLAYPLDITVDGAGYIYVSDYYNNRIQKVARLATAGIIQLLVDESACPIRLQAQASGSEFVFSGPNGYYFSEVHRQVGSYQPVAVNVKAPGIYQLKAVSTNECGSSAPVSQTVTVTRSCP